MNSRFSMEEMADRLAIYDLVARYVHAVDAQELEILDKEVFLPDTILDWSDAGGERVTWSEAKSGDFITGRIYSMCFHMCGNILIELDKDGQTAHLKSKTIHPAGMEDKAGKTHLFQVHGRYADILTRTVAGWRFAERKWLHDWVAGGLQIVDGIPGMLQQVGRI